MSFAEKLLEHRQGRYWTQEELARRAGLTKITILRLENGQTPPSLRTVNKLATLFKIDPSELATPSEISDWRSGRDHAAARRSAAHRNIVESKMSTSCGEMLILQGLGGPESAVFLTLWCQKLAGHHGLHGAAKDQDGTMIYIAWRKPGETLDTVAERALGLPSQ